MIREMLSERVIYQQDKQQMRLPLHSHLWWRCEKRSGHEFCDGRGVLLDSAYEV